MNKVKPQPGPRRIVLIDNAFQIKYSVLLFLGALVASTICCTIVLFSKALFLTELELPKDVRVELEGLNERMAWIAIGACLLMSTFLAVVGFLFTHRVAGPVFAMTRYAAALAEGRYPVIRPLRKRDEFKDFFSLFQKTVEYLRSREVEEGFRLEEAISTLRRLDSIPEAKQVLQTLQALHERKHQAIHRSVLSPDPARAIPKARA